MTDNTKSAAIPLKAVDDAYITRSAAYDTLKAIEEVYSAAYDTLKAAENVYAAANAAYNTAYKAVYNDDVKKV